MGFRYSTWMFFTLALLCLLFLDVSPTEAQQLAFPGAEGYGSYSKGGRGGEIVRVTTLNDSGPGSLRAAVEREGPRVVMFEVGGIVDLESPLTISDPYITIAGETAPEPGITIRGQQLQVQSHDVIVRFIRFRPGDKLPRNQVSWGSLDAVDIGKRDSDEVRDIIFDHCSFSWATDENIGIWHNTKRVTIQNSIISEGLHHNRNNPESTGQGLLIGADATEISVLRNLFAHNAHRNPYMNANGTLDFRNNMIYNAGERVIRLFNGMGEKQRVNVVNNLIISGPDSDYTHEISIRLTSRSRLYNGKIFLQGNQTTRNESATEENWQMVVDEESGEPFSEEVRSHEAFKVVRTSTLPVGELSELLTGRAGAVLPARDEVDRRIVQEVERRRGSHISSPSEVMGWPLHEESRRPLRGRFEEWELLSGVDLSDPSEALVSGDEDGYTNLELFLHSLASEERIAAGAAGSSEASAGGMFLAASQEQREGFEVGDNFPNPFQDRTHVNVSIHSRDEYRLDVYDSQGRRVHQLMDRRELVPGEYQMHWDPVELASGVYFLRLHSPRKILVQQMTLIR